MDERIADHTLSALLLSQPNESNPVISCQQRVRKHTKREENSTNTPVAMSGSIKKESDMHKIDLSAAKSRVNHAKRVLDRAKKHPGDAAAQSDVQKCVAELQEVVDQFGGSSDVALKDYAAKDVKVCASCLFVSLLLVVDVSCGCSTLHRCCQRQIAGGSALSLRRMPTCNACLLHPESITETLLHNNRCLLQSVLAQLKAAK